jgi:hypothetical protein
MSDLATYAERELKYHLRKNVAKQIRDNTADNSPMVSEITVMLGTVIALAVFSAMIGKGRGR